jgi:hypothetical protein
VVATALNGFERHIRQFKMISLWVVAVVALLGAVVGDLLVR